MAICKVRQALVDQCSQPMTRSGGAPCGSRSRRTQPFFRSGRTCFSDADCVQGFWRMYASGPMLQADQHGRNYSLEIDNIATAPAVQVSSTRGHAQRRVNFDLHIENISDARRR
jgi:hypothetical protein